MASLTAAERHALKPSDFVFPGTEGYPIDTEARARAALSRVAHDGTPAQKAAVRRAVHKRYPGMAMKDSDGDRDASHEAFSEAKERVRRGS